MSGFNLDALGDNQFESLSQALLKEVIGNGTITFGAGPDGGREATFSGTAPYPSKTETWDGEWIFQAKFHDTNLLGVEKARKKVLADLEGELQKITQKYKRRCDNYILITNVPLTPYPDTGTLDKIIEQISPKYRKLVKNIHVWGFDDVSRMLEKYVGVRTSYLHLIVPGDVIAELLAERKERLSELAITVQAFLAGTFNRDQYAQLEQAGDVKDPVRIQQVFFELNSRLEVGAPVGVITREAASRFGDLQVRIGDYAAYPTLRLLLTDSLQRVVLVGGPGEGKSTIGQYLAQLHRASLLGKDIAINPLYLPLIPRIPLRVILRDFAQWLGENSDAEQKSLQSLDEYLCEHIRQNCSRSIDAQALHTVIRANPTLLILDGLDEVTDPALQKLLLDRVEEFTQRCVDVLRADMQVLATTRPTGYTDQFDPHRFLHLRLTSLESPQIRDYVNRWIAARDLEYGKAKRLRENIEECLHDEQIRPLMNTPLQVTILVLIISNGGTPPRQREALFDEYLEVIYKRETAKGRNIISSNKELLIGLHKYIGYILHEESTKASATKSYLERKSYERLVSTYLKHFDPYSSKETRDKQFNGITKESNERLVLIVEPHKDAFGFELRSLQEFFAACHLADTSVDTNQRYSRFEKIGSLTHWRNVALFFAGRVGRSFSGESAGLIEVCRDYDTRMPDVFVRRGSLLALELAVDKAFGPNRRLQRSLLEVGLRILETDLSLRRMSIVSELIMRLPEEDLHDLVGPLLMEKVNTLAPQRLGNVLYMSMKVSKEADLINVAVSKMKSGNDTDYSLLKNCLTSPQRVSLEAERVAEIFEKVGIERVSELVVADGLGSIGDSFRALANASNSATTVELAKRTISMLSPSVAISLVEGEALTEEVKNTWPSDVGLAIIQAFATLIYFLAPRYSTFRRSQLRGNVKSVEAGDLHIPHEVIAGQIDRYCRSMALAPGRPEVAVFWVVHLALGKPTRGTVRKCVSYFQETGNDAFVCAVTMAASSNRWVIPDFLRGVALQGGHPNLGELYRVVASFSGTNGRIRFSKHAEAVWRYFVDSPKNGVRQAIRFALGLDVQLDKFVSLEFKQAFVLDDLLLSTVLQDSGPQRGVDCRVECGELIERLRTGAPFTQLVAAFLDRSSLVVGNKSTEWREIRVKYLHYLLANLDGELSKQALFGWLADGLANGEVERDLMLDCLSCIGRMELHSRLGQVVVRGWNRKGWQKVVRKMLEVYVDSTMDMDVRRGAGRTIVRLCETAAGPVPMQYRISGTAVRFSGFADLHRSIIMLNDLDHRKVCTALFLVRYPQGYKDWELLKALFVEIDDLGQMDMLRNLGSRILADHGRRIQWIELLCELIPLVSYSELRSEMVEWLEMLQAMEEQSLRAFEDDLGLPLQDV
ncbi:NACHT domain-containing NTPase [Kutzneria buriramensis]|uniref:NACHT domain-containing protein n=1 Tax=Kutzneria buriramensis TaxID=1045776 RepID=A0A3E0HLG2_9PSEU|nr:hypothetical protein [Kutzneria buriramensis]REH47046.1 hypothetical protein BCF44_106210 [Kutzneria buriramensis]